MNKPNTPTIKMQELTHPTLPSGWKVHINNEKFPKEHGFWYTLSKNESREHALQSWKELHKIK
ncbi:MAG: hypothetical protein KAS04_00755 [Candidatus Aenigmarchaeota archaeon]|nr:hypothetical protein [Candidatus Aenigmarchaeota archaeon]